MGFYRPAPHAYTVTLTVGPVSMWAKSHSLNGALSAVVAKVQGSAAGRPNGDALVATAKKATARLLAAWRGMGRPEAIHIHPGTGCAARIKMIRV
jgi:hypothetical protein